MPATAHLVLPHQLFDAQLDTAPEAGLILLEHDLLIRQLPFHVHKLVLHRASLRRFARRARSRGRTVHVLDSRGDRSSRSQLTALLRRLGVVHEPDELTVSKQADGVSTVAGGEPTEYDPDAAASGAAAQLTVQNLDATAGRTLVDVGFGVTGGVPPRAAGLFAADAGGSVPSGPFAATGLAARLRVNASVDPQRGGDVALLYPNQLVAVRTVYAMTIHRSQGSQYEAVSVVIPPADSRLLTRELLYTAITRARQRVRLVGGEEALRAGVERQVLRASGLRGDAGV